MIRQASVLLPAHPEHPLAFGQKRIWPWLSFLRGECNGGVEDGESITPISEKLFDGALVEEALATSQRFQKSQLGKKSNCEDSVSRLVSPGR